MADDHNDIQAVAISLIAKLPVEKALNTRLIESLKEISRPRLEEAIECFNEANIAFAAILKSKETPVSLVETGRDEFTARRNIAIIAPVDHGKTTFVDELLQQSGYFRENQRLAERVMDSNDLKKEHSITILAKATSIVWKDTRINIVDTLGHADVGGEVERILNMVDGAIVLVDAADGPMPQTKFVVAKALKMGLKPIVAINKVDKPDAHVTDVVNEVFNLFALDATDEQLDFPILYGSSSSGWMSDTPGQPPNASLAPLFDLVLKHVPAPKVELGPFRMLGTLLEADPFLGRIITGRIASGTVKINQTVNVLDQEGKVVETGRVSKILAFRGIERQPIEVGEAGDIVSIVGFVKGSVADTFCDPSVDTPIQAQSIDPPTVTMCFMVNDSPFAGSEGVKVTSRMIRDRLLKESEGNITLKIKESTGEEPTEKHSFDVSSRSELQLSILIETMRREGFELGVSRPRAVMQEDEAGGLLEPIEEVVIDLDEEHSGIVVQKMSERRAVMVEMRPSGGNRQRQVFHAPTRGLIGYESELMTLTRGTAIMNRVFKDYEPFKGDISIRSAVITSTKTGIVTADALSHLPHGGGTSFLFVAPGDKVYEGQIIGRNRSSYDVDVDPTRRKRFGTSAASDHPKKTEMSVIEAITILADDELAEITPLTVRLRKLHLTANERIFHRSKAADEAA